MKILFIGDIVGKPGRQVVIDLLPSIKNKHNIDFVIANGENAAHGKGITKKIYNQLISAGVDVITLGNHAYAKSDVYEIIDENRLIRPLNYLQSTKGKGIRVFECFGKRVLVSSIVGSVFMNNVLESPFTAIKEVIEYDADIKIVDFHAEATSEKIAFAYAHSKYLNAVLGTHTHVQTADERLIDNCAFITDVGMCGPYESILGRDINEVIDMMVYNKTTKYTVSNSKAIFCGVVLDIKNNKTISIERVQIRP